MRLRAFEARTERLRTFAAKFPLLFRLMCWALVGVGSGYLALVGLVLPFIAVVLSASSFISFSQNFEKMDLLLGLFFLAVGLATIEPFIRTLLRWKPYSEKGIRLRESDHPELYSMVNAVRQELRAPEITEVSIVPGLDLHVSSPPRQFGIGKSDHFLTIGYSCFQLFDQEEFKALIAHEVAHLSGRENRLSRMLRFKLMNWRDIRDALKSRSLYCSFFSWPLDSMILPTLSVVWQSTSWESEFESDRLAVKISGKRTYLKALLKMEVLNTLQQFVFWEELFATARNRAEPPANLYELFEQFIRKESKKWQWLGALSWICARKHSAFFHHPPSPERFQKMGFDSQQLKSCCEEVFSEEHSSISDTEAARSLLGKDFSELGKLFSRSWFEEKRQQWKTYFQLIQRRMNSLDYFEKQEKAGDLSDAEHFDWLLGLTMRDGVESVIPKWQKYLNDHPEHLGARYELGAALAQVNDDMGLGLLAQVAKRSIAFRPKAAWKSCQFFYQSNHFDDAKEKEAEAAEWMWQMRAAKWECATLSHEDQFAMVLKSEAERQYFAQRVATLPQIKHAWLVRKCPESDPEYPFLVLFIQCSAWKLPSDQEYDVLIDAMAPCQIEMIKPITSSITMSQWSEVLNLPGAKLF